MMSSLGGFCSTAVLLEIQKQIQGRNLIFRVLISTLSRHLNLLWISIMHNANPYPGYGLIWVCGWQSISIPWICRSPWPTFASHHHTCSPVPLRDKHGHGQNGQSNSCRWALPRDPQCPLPPPVAVVGGHFVGQKSPRCPGTRGL